MFRTRRIISLLLALMYRIITQQVIDPVRRLQEMLGYFREHREKSPAEEAPTSGDEFEVLAHDITEVQDIILQDSEQLQEYLDDISEYDNIVIAGPCWWGTYPCAVFTQLEKLRFRGNRGEASVRGCMQSPYAI